MTLVLTCWWGQPLLDLFGISLPAFRIAGGLILLPYGLRLIEGIALGNSPMALDEDEDEDDDARMVAVVPIGLRSRWWWRRHRPIRSEGSCSAG